MVVGELTQETDLLVIGGGPGGYVAACAAADAGLKTTLIEKAEVPGGVCLREGCIPSKALLHVAKIINESQHAAEFGVTFAKPQTDITKLRDWKNGVIRKLSTGVKQLLAARKVEYITGIAEFESSTTVHIEGSDVARVKFRHCIIASGSVAKMLPESLITRDLCWDAADALKMQEIPKRLLVIGGGYIGLELGQVYATLGSEVTVLEALPNILAGADPDLARPLIARLKKQTKAIITSASLKGAKKKGDAVSVTWVEGDRLGSPKATTVEGDPGGSTKGVAGDGKPQTEDFDRVLVSVGRRPNSADLGLGNTKVRVNDRGFIEVDAQRRTTDKRIFAIGDVACEPMLAHKAMREAKVAVDAITGKPAAFDPACIPAVVYTDPEVAWCGVTEAEAKAKGLDVKVTKFPWAASGRAVAMGRTDGLTKMIFDKKTQRLLGVGIVGAHAGDLISEAVLGMEMAAVAEDIGASIHPHPATSETLGEAAEAMFGNAIHMGH